MWKNLRYYYQIMLLNSLSKYVLCCFLPVYLIKLGAQLTFDALFVLRDLFVNFTETQLESFPNTQTMMTVDQQPSLNKKIQQSLKMNLQER